MKIRTILAASFVSSGFILGCALPSFACPLALSAAGSGSYVVQGTGLENVGAIGLTITYDVSTLANPRVTPGSLLTGAMQAVNAASPGEIRMSVISTQGISGSGSVASISFDPVGSSPGKISLRCDVADVRGVAQNEQSDDTSSGGGGSPSENPAVTAGGGSAPYQSPSSGGGGQTIWIGGVNLQSGDIPTLEGREKEGREKTAPADPAPEPRQETKPQPRTEETAPPLRAESVPDKPEQPAASIPATRVEKMPEPPQEVLALFRDFRGERTMAAFVALFDRKEAYGFRQLPPIAISDGTATVKIHLLLPGGEPVPRFILKGALLNSLKAEGNEWAVEAIPEKGAFAASLSAILGSRVLEFPLTVAPRVETDLDKSGNVTEKDFALYLERRSAKKPAKAAGEAGKQPDYIEDYSFTANYLVARQKPASGDAATARK